MKFQIILLLLFLGLLFNSCGLFLQKTGMKNYSLKEKIEKKNYNDYQYDFIYLTKLLDLGFPQIDSVFPINERLQLQQRITKSLANKNLKNKDFIMHSRKYLSNFHNEHTSIYLKSIFDTIYPFKIFISNDKWLLFNIDNNKDSLLIGKEIVKINDFDIREIENRLLEFTFSENKICQQYELRNNSFCNIPSYLKEASIIKTLTESMKITFSDESVIYLEPQPKTNFSWYQTKNIYDEITIRQNKTYSYGVYPNHDFGYLQFNRCHDKIDILDGIETYVKPWLQPAARSYVKREFKKDKPSKRIASYYNPDYPVFKDFVWELIDSLNNNNITNLIIDLRNNPGGNITLGIQLMYFLTDNKNLKGFNQYAYTSDLYKNHFQTNYKKLEKLYPNGIPENELVSTHTDTQLFIDITDEKSKYFIPENRPIFKGDVYVIANYRTGSAAGMLTTLIQDNNVGVIVGTSVGNNPTGATTYTPIKLPKTKAHVSIASTYKERPSKGKNKILIPNHWVEYSVNDLFTGNDPYLEKVKELINLK